MQPSSKHNKDEERFMMFNDFNFCGQEEEQKILEPEEEDKSPELSVIASFPSS